MQQPYPGRRAPSCGEGAQRRFWGSGSHGRVQRQRRGQTRVRGGRSRRPRGAGLFGWEQRQRDKDRESEIYETDHRGGDGQHHGRREGNKQHRSHGILDRGGSPGNIVPNATQIHLEISAFMK